MEGRLGAAHVSARAVRALSKLCGHVGGRLLPEKEVEDAVNEVVALLELATGLVFDKEDLWHDSDDFVGSDEQE